MKCLINHAGVVIEVAEYFEKIDSTTFKRENITYAKVTEIDCGNSIIAGKFQFDGNVFVEIQQE